MQSIFMLCFHRAYWNSTEADKQRADEKHIVHCNSHVNRGDMCVQVRGTKQCCTKQSCVPLRFNPKRHTWHASNAANIAHVASPMLCTMFQNVGSNVKSCEIENQQGTKRFKGTINSALKWSMAKHWWERIVKNCLCSCGNETANDSPGFIL